MELPNLARKRQVRFDTVRSPSPVDPEIQNELTELMEAKDAGITYVLGHSYVRAKKSSSMLKKFIVDVAYTFLRRNCRDPTIALSIPHICLIEVGMVYYV